MVRLQKNTILKMLVEHIEEQRKRANLINAPFELGVATDKKPSYIFKVINENFSILEDLGMKKYQWHDDALRSRKRISGEELYFSISAMR